MNKFKRTNYITILGWMRTDFDLKGNELLVFALIYGFSQDTETKFNGSISYIQDAIGASKNTVMTTLKKITEKGLLDKHTETRKGVSFNSYSCSCMVVQKLDPGGAKIGFGGGAKIGHNNTIPLDNNINTDKELSLFKNIEEEVLDYLNEVKPSKIAFKPTSSNLKHIKLRIKDKFTLEDFKKVIVFKVKEWKDSVKNSVRT